MCCRLQKQRQQTANGEQQTVNRVYRQVNTTRNLCAMRINSADTRKTRYEKLKSRWQRKSTFLATSRWTCFGSVAFDYSNAAPGYITCSSFARQIRLALIFWETSSQCDCNGQTSRQTYWQLILGKIVNIFLWTFATWQASWPGHQIS